jgi:uncharacterized integral membrane protein
MKVALILAFAIALVMALFAVQNSQHTQVSFLGWYFNGPLVIILLLTFGSGAITAFLAMLPGSVRKSIEISKLKTKLTDHSAQLAVLKKMQETKEPQPQKSTGDENPPQEP